uniref:Uncharacterized protein n=1 Tax=Candidatus Kentrum sp. LFY TaxID=2126342 RepID=A0A450UKX8_9GAMM|nr:MAG: hypothetical protein BECKLFY1418A_GA0070994_102922 [Candidatus Kentron sp. LFY]
MEELEPFRIMGKNLSVVVLNRHTIDSTDDNRIFDDRRRMVFVRELPRTELPGAYRTTSYDIHPHTNDQMERLAGFSGKPIRRISIPYS